MTIIAYKDGVIASDSQAASRGWLVVGEFEKIGRREVYCDGVIGSDKPDVYLYGSSGEAAYQAKFNRWMQSEAFEVWLKTREGGPEIEPDGKDDVCMALLIMPDGSCVRFEGNYPWYVVNAPFYVLGSGEIMAVGALAANATAEEAVAICIQHDGLSNGVVKSFKR